MTVEKNPPEELSHEQRSLLATEQQLLMDGRQWLSRAAELYTRTPKIKIWLPVLGSLLITVYYLFSIHQRASAAPELPPPTVQSVPVAVLDVTPLSKAPPFVPPAQFHTTVNDTDGNQDNAALHKQAEQAHADKQFGDEAKLLQTIADHSGAPQLVCPALGTAYERAGDLDSATLAFEQCVAAEPGNIDALLAFAHVMQTKHDFNRARTLYRQCLLKDPANMDALGGLALIELTQNHLDQANQAAQAMLRKSPENTDALLITGVVAWRQARLADAEKIFLKGVGLDDHRADFHAFLGRIAEAERRPEDALRQYQRALELDPHDVDITDRRDRLKDRQ
jgi:Tfp pilus assembly protein PilF